MYSYTFKSGSRFVTIEAGDVDEARVKAREKLDTRFAEEDLESPVSHTLYLVRIES